MEDCAVKNSNPERLIFQTDLVHRNLDQNLPPTTKPFVKDARGWILFGPTDIRGGARRYLFCLQKLPSQKLPRVRAGCRYYTLAEAYRHWNKKVRRGSYYAGRNEGRQALAIIRLMLLQAQAYSLPGMSLYSTPIKFDSTILKLKRKK
jgi:hypothetical protein